MIDNKRLILIGSVTEALPNTTFRVKLENGTEILAHLSGKMRLNFIRVLVGDQVEVEPSSDNRRGRIIRRL
ncbi:translation initiation factor IF-1 [Candidatus Azambacteria bacterium RIFCSPHIGHO2_01_FULL_40_24]|uniref:Translation initiation factor IF-1 n=1 Tax=Candidatus Azambacteria bacterium RIFCSPHIGHO2_01_FULL_40_24 TaxID=1797301 RepID=A0A1F5B2R0_9BACT|nr:MAG: translation initiation factor IF-1 [Candidatus Azambacteria bacterium RIFCSPHIGHO2_01_FULL_40_24]